MSAGASLSLAWQVVGAFTYLDHPVVLAIAHRGGAGDWPENTFPAFQAAIDLGYRYLETDVHATSDGVLVAFHDDRLDRVTDRSGAIGRLSYAEVARARVGGTERIPRLSDLLDAFPEARFNIDAKADSSVEPLISIIEKMGVLDRVCVGSFSDRRIGALRRALGGGLCHSLGPAGVARLRAASYGVPVGRIAAPCVQVPPTTQGRTLIDRRFVATAHARNMQVHVWTVDDPIEMHRLLELGVDGIMTDRPGVLRDVLIERGQW